MIRIFIIFILLPAIALAQVSTDAEGKVKSPGDFWSANAADIASVVSASVAADWSNLTNVPAAVSAIGSLTPTADRLVYFNNSAAPGLLALSALGYDLLGATSETARTLLGVAIGSDVQPFSTSLSVLEIELADDSGLLTWSESVNGTVKRALVAGSNIDITNPDGDEGDPTIALANNLSISGSITSTGTSGALLSIGSGTDAGAVIGSTAIGSFGASGFMTIAHASKANATNYALMQSAAGQTNINASNEQSVIFRTNNQVRASVDADFLHLYSGLTLRFEGATNDNYETVLNVVDPTDDRTINLPNASGTIALLESSQTWTRGQAIVGGVDEAQMRVRANATQTGPVLMAEDAAGATVAAIDAEGNITAKSLSLAPGTLVLDIVPISGTTLDLSGEGNVVEWTPSTDEDQTVTGVTGGAAGAVYILRNASATRSLTLNHNSDITVRGAYDLVLAPNEIATILCIDSTSISVH